MGRAYRRSQAPNSGEMRAMLPSPSAIVTTLFSGIASAGCEILFQKQDSIKSKRKHAEHYNKNSKVSRSEDRSASVRGCISDFLPLQPITSAPNRNRNHNPMN